MATTAPFSATWTPGLGQANARLQGFGAALIKAVRRGLVRNAELMATELRGLTPRSAETSVHVADGWSTRQIKLAGGRGTGGQFQAASDFAVEVFNADPRFDAPKKLAGGSVTSLGLMLEFGTAPHKIEAKNGKALAFFWPVVGQQVTVKSINHPGTKPYAFMLVATGDATDRARKLLEAALQVARGQVR